MTDTITIARVANGWVMRTGMNAIDEFTHVYMTPEDVAQHVKKWAEGTAAAQKKDTKP